MVFFMDLEVLGQILDTVRQQADLDFRGPRIGFMAFKLFNQFFFLIRCKNHFLSASYRLKERFVVSG